jgi:hypothetical protein
MSLRTKIFLIGTPVLVTFCCVFWQLEFPQAWQFPMPLWLCSLLVIFAFTAPRWWDAPIAFRQVADQLTYGVIASFAIMILVTYASEMLHP